MVEVDLIQWNLVDDHYQQRYEVLYTFRPNKSYVYLLNIESSKLLLLKNYSTEFDEIIITFTDQKSRALEIEDKVNLRLLISE